MKMILGKKVGMTQIFTEAGDVVPVTVIEAGPEVVTQIKTVETDGYNAVQVGFEDQKPQRVNKPMTGHFAKNDIPVKKHLAEFRTEEGVEKARAKCEELGLEGIVVIGGDGSFRGAADLSAKGILCVGLPGTIDNDIACTEYTIGYDTAMNTVVEMVDKLRDTTQSHDRCSVVEVMGRGAGYIALNAGIACGATYVITSEIPYDLDKVAKKMLESRKTGKQHFIIVVSEGVGHSDEIARTLQDKTGIEARTTILGHVQRGGAPTVRDRVVASQMAYYAVELLSQGIGNRVVGMQNSKIVDFDIQEALSMKKPFEEELYHIAGEIAF